MEKTLGQKTAEAIRKSGLSQREVAEKVGITEVSLSRYLRDDRVPKGPVIAKIAEAIGASIDSLLGDGSEETKQKAEKGYPDKYVVILEIDGGYMDCIAVCDTAAEAYGEAYLALCDGVKPGEYIITVPDDREGENGLIISRRNSKTCEEDMYVTILFYRKEE